MPVTIVTPVGKCPSTLRNWAESNGESACVIGRSVAPHAQAPRATLRDVQDKRSLRGRDARRPPRRSPPIPPTALARSARIWSRHRRRRPASAAAPGRAMLFEALPTEPDTAGWFAWCREHDVAGVRAGGRRARPAASSPGDRRPGDARRRRRARASAFTRRRPPARPGRRPLRPLPAPAAPRLRHDRRGVRRAARRRPADRAARRPPRPGGDRCLTPLFTLADLDAGRPSSCAATSR